jgi:prepilin-type N-terminal cleavage/methylation domain-containing protein
MFARIQRARESESGFTLIELLIVIVILGILAAVVVFAVSGITDKGTLSACKSDVKSFDTAAEAYYAQNGSGAQTLQALVDGGFLHKDNGIQGTSKVASGYTITFTPGNTTSAGNADSASLTGCA